MAEAPHIDPLTDRHNPVDPDVKLPEAVRRRTAAVDALYAAQQQPPQANGQPAAPAVQPSPPDQVTPPAAAVPDQPPLSPTPPPAVPPPTTSLARQQPGDPVDPNDLTWQGRYLAVMGRYEGAQKTIGEMQEQMTQLGDELIRTQQTRSSAPPPAPLPQPPRQYVTEEDVRNYGTDLVDFAQRAAIQAVSPRLEYMQGENETLKQQLAREAKLRMDMVLDVRIPNWREINQNPRFHAWLRLPDVYSSRVRQGLLDEAVSTGNAARVISFFNGFLNEERATGHLQPAPMPDVKPPREPAVPLASLAAPGGARPATGGESSYPPEMPTYTRARIAELYRAHRKGAYVGREQEWARQEQDLFAAQREGRVIG